MVSLWRGPGRLAVPNLRRLALVAILVVFLGLGLALSLVAPLDLGSDQVAHFYFARFIASHGRLPVNWEERHAAGYKSDWPPLFHLLVGLTGRSLDLDSPPFIKVNDEPRVQLVFGTGDLISWHALTTEDPYQGEVLLWRLGRWFTLLAGLAGVGAAYLLFRAFTPEQPWLAVGSAALLAFTPTYVLTSGVLSYEPLLGALLALYFWLLFYTLHQPTRDRLYFGLGLLLGLAALTKYTPVPVFPLLYLFVLGLGYRQRWTWQVIAWRLALVSLGLALTFGSWLFYTEFYFNRVGELGWINGLLHPLLGDRGDDTSRRLAGLVSGGLIGDSGPVEQRDSAGQWLWNFIEGIWPAPWLATLFVALWLAALAGCVRRWSQAAETARLWLLLLIAHVGLLMSLPFMRFFLTGMATTGEGYHIFFPAGAALLLIFTWGLGAWLSPARLAWLVAGLAGLSLGQSVVMVAAAYSPPWPVQTVPLAGEQVLAAFPDLSLIGYQAVAGDLALKTTLVWRSEALLGEDYQVELSLVDHQGRSQTRWLGQPLNGRYPTRAWQPGDRVRDTLYLPAAGLPAGTYRVRLRLLGVAGPVVASSDSPIPDGGLTLGEVKLAPAPAAAASRLKLGAQEIGYTLWQDGRPAATIPDYGERATITISTREPLGEGVRLTLLGPDEQPRAPVDRVGLTYIFRVEPFFASGAYRLRAEGPDKTQAESPALLTIQTEERQFELKEVFLPVQANFANQVLLLGYSLPGRRVEPGGSLPVTIHWQALRTIGADLIIFNDLVDGTGQAWGDNDRRARETYSTMLWAPGEIISDGYTVPVAAGAPEGIYQLLVGLYLPVGQAPAALPLVEDGQLTSVTSVSLGPVKVGHTPSGLTVKEANPQTRLNQPFGANPELTLLGYDLEVSSAPASPGLKLKLYWRCVSPLSLDYTTFVHIRNERGETVAQEDEPPLDGAYPTSLWDPGEMVADEVTVPLPAGLVPGKYRIVIGMYDFLTGRRLAVPGSPADELVLTTVEIK